MQRVTIGSLAALAAVVLGGPAAQARIMAPAPVPDRVVKADAVVVGKVTAIEDKTIQAAGQEYQVAVVQVGEALTGAKGLTHVRIAFVPRGNPRFPQLNLTVGQEACFFLTQSAVLSCYTTANYFDVVEKKNPAFDKDVALARHCAQLLTDPNAGLKSKDADERMLTVSMLLTRYRVPPPASQPPLKQEPIDAEQSKLILLALAEADWTKTDPALRLPPQAMFVRLGATAKDGWTPPKDFKEFPEAAKKWLRENADKYRVQRYVTEKKN